MVKNDLISRSALIAALENEKIRIAVDKGKMFGLIEAAPAVDAVPVRRGRWIYEPETINLKLGYKCSACRGTKWFSPDVPQAFSFCPRCGAKMDLEEN